MRSADYGSPNYRERVYMIGIRLDIVDERSLDRMVKFIHTSASVHVQCNLVDCSLV